MSLNGDIEAVLERADAIRHGEDGQSAPASATGDEVRAEPGSASCPVSAPSPEAEQLAQLAVLLTDYGFTLAFGPHATMAGPILQEAIAAWSRVIAAYLPAIQNLGPVAALAAVYLTHTISCLAILSAPSAKPEAEKLTDSASLPH